MVDDKTTKKNINLVRVLAVVDVASPSLIVVEEEVGTSLAKSDGSNFPNKCRASAAFQAIVHKIFSDKKHPRFYGCRRFCF